MQSNNASAPKLKTLLISRTFNLPLSQLWKAWTEPESYRKWWGPKDYTCCYCSIELEIGGKNLSCMRSLDGREIWTVATYREIKPMSKIIYVDSFSDDKGNEVAPSVYNMPEDWAKKHRISISCEEVDGKTKMVLQHEGMPVHIHDRIEQGWQSAFDKLELAQS